MIATLTAWALVAWEFLKAVPRPVYYALGGFLAGAGCVHGCH